MGPVSFSIDIHFSCYGRVRVHNLRSEGAKRAYSAKRTVSGFLDHPNIVLLAEGPDLIGLYYFGLSAHPVELLVVFNTYLGLGQRWQMPGRRELSNIILFLLVLDTIGMIRLGQVVRSRLTPTDIIPGQQHIPLLEHRFLN